MGFLLQPDCVSFVFVPGLPGKGPEYCLVASVCNATVTATEREREREREREIEREKERGSKRVK